jgi:hypothetical protein
VARNPGNMTAGIEAVPRKRRLKCLADLDLRSKAGQYALRLRNALVSDLAGDPTAAQRELCQRAAVLGAMIEHDEVEWMNGR